MLSHLLSPAALHAAAPGVLDVIACFDGDFPDAPIFHPPLWDGRRWVWDYRWSDQPIEGLALDLRIPSVAARLAGLCARALGFGSSPAHVWTDGPDEWWLMSSSAGECGVWNNLGEPHPDYEHAGDMPSIGPVDSEEHFIAALTLALAPRIVALRGTR